MAVISEVGEVKENLYSKLNLKIVYAEPNFIKQKCFMPYVQNTGS